MRRAAAILALIALAALGAGVAVFAAGGDVLTFTFTDGARTATVPKRVHTVTVSGKLRTVTDPARTYTFAGQTHSVTTTLPDATTAPTTTAPSGEPAPIAGQGYTKVFGDEFDGTALDTTAWSPKEFWEDEPRAGAVVVSNGTVKISNARPYYGDQSISTGPYWGLEQSKKSWMFGYFEARMKFTDAKGSWPAFWLLSREQAEWPNYPSCTNRDLNFELDIMEYQGDERTQFYGTQHRNTGDVCGTPDTTRSVFTNPGSLAGAWHVFSAKWTATTVSWYVDDVLQGSQPLFDSGDQQMVMSLTMQACGWDSTNSCDAATPDPLVTEVDWVRVWQLP